MEALHNTQFTCLPSKPAQTASSSLLTLVQAKGSISVGHPWSLWSAQQLRLGAHVHLVCPRAALCSGRLCPILLTLPKQTGCQQPAAGLGEGTSRSRAGRHSEPLSAPAGSREGEAGAHLLQFCSAANGKRSDLRNPRKVSECTGYEGRLKKPMPAWPWCALNIGNNFPG